MQSFQEDMELEMSKEIPLEERIAKISAYFDTEAWADQMRKRYFVGREIFKEWEKSFNPYLLSNGIDWAKRGQKLMSITGGDATHVESLAYSLRSLRKLTGYGEKQLKRWIDFAYLIDQETEIEQWIKDHYGLAFNKALQRLKGEEEPESETFQTIRSLYFNLQTVSNCIDKIENYVIEDQKIEVGNLNIAEFWRRASEAFARLQRLGTARLKDKKLEETRRLEWKH